MNPRTLLAAALCCAAMPILGCGTENDVGRIDTGAADDRSGPMESYRVDAKFRPTSRLFLQYGQPIPATEVHDDYVADFLRQPGAGFGRFGAGGPLPPDSEWNELVAVSHGEQSLRGDSDGDGEIAYDRVAEALVLRDGTRLERRERVWLLADRQLVSVTAEAGPAVYLNSPKKQHELMKPKPSGATAPKQPLDAFEKEALEKLRTGDEVALRSDDRQLRMLGAIRARQDCLACHKVEVGTLLGAFTYTLKAQSEETPEAHRLTDKAGLTDQEVWAVRSIEAVGGKVIRAPGGPVTEVRMTFSRSQEIDAAPHMLSTRLQLHDSALPHLLPFRDLTALDLSRSLVSDAGLKTVAELKNLKRLDLSQTRVTEEGMAELKKALPKCEIITDSPVPGP